MPAWASSRRRNLRRTLAPCGNTTGVMFIALLIITATLTWLLVRGGGNTSSPLSRIPDAAVARPRPRVPSPQNPAQIVVTNPNAANSTLNFEKIFAINLPSRLDRKDTLTLMAAYANLSVTIVPGVSSIAENALPPPRRPGSVRMEEYAVWRAHANVWRRIIENDITTALILEDDNDWDVNLKDQVPRIFNALDELTRSPPPREEEGVVRGETPNEPWDLLYLGTCMEKATPAERRNRRTFIPIPSDNENVAPHNYNWVEDILRQYDQIDPATRILQRASVPQCTHSYAVTANGARKLLYHTSLNLDKRLDMAIVDLVRSNLVNAFSVIPPIMVQWKTKERAAKDTDVGYEVWPVKNWGFAHSTRYRLRKEMQVGFDPSGEE